MAREEEEEEEEELEERGSGVRASAGTLGPRPPLSALLAGSGKYGVEAARSLAPSSLPPLARPLPLRFPPPSLDVSCSPQGPDGTTKPPAGGGAGWNRSVTWREIKQQSVETTAEDIRKQGYDLSGKLCLDAWIALNSGPPHCQPFPVI